MRPLGDAIKRGRGLPDVDINRNMGGKGKSHMVDYDPRKIMADIVIKKTLVAASPAVPFYRLAGPCPYPTRVCSEPHRVAYPARAGGTGPFLVLTPTFSSAVLRVGGLAAGRVRVRQRGFDQRAVV